MNGSKPLLRPAGLLACLALALTGAGSLAWAGGELGMPDDNHDDEGPSYFGFVKDARGNPVPDAKVSASVKNGVTLVTHTTALGLYKIGGLSKDVNPNDVTISCAKEGYRQTRVLRRTAPGPGKSPDKPKPIETECRLERG